MNPISLIPSEIIVIHDQQLFTDSRKVAEAFGKQHQHITQKIEKLDCSAQFSSSNFSLHVENQQVGTARRDIKYYEMTKDGFMFLVMGFTGKQAAAIKEGYINAFNRMEEILREQQAQPLSLLTAQLRSSRFCLTLDEAGMMNLREIPAEAVMVTGESLPRLLADPSGPFGRYVMVDVIEAAAKRLKK